MKLISCSGLTWIYGQLGGGGGVRSFMKIIQCNGLPEMPCLIDGGIHQAKVCSSATFELIYISCLASQKVFLYYI